jgi:hypothetical protein
MSDTPTPLEYKRWPFVETPQEFTSRLSIALAKFAGDLSAAVCYVLIEKPPELAPTQASTVSESCASCRFSDWTGTQYLNCKRHAPIAKDEPDRLGGITEAHWPMVHSNQWCGDYEAGEEV